MVVQSSIVFSWISNEALLAVEQLPDQAKEAFLPFHFLLMARKDKKWFLPWSKQERTQPSYLVAGKCFFLLWFVCWFGF